MKQSAANFLIAVGILFGVAPHATPVSAQATGSAPSPSSLVFSYDHATLSVANLDKEVAWYERVLGLKVTDREKKSDSFEIAEMRMPAVRIDMSWRKGSARNRIPEADMDQGWAHVVFAAPDLEADYKKLTALNVEVREDRKKDSSAILRLLFHDAEGNEITIKKLDASQTPADNPLHISPDHLSLSVADMDKELDWYERALGFKLLNRNDIGGNEIIGHLGVNGNLIDLTWDKGSARHGILKGDLEQGWHHMTFTSPNLDAIYNHLVAEHADVRTLKDKDGKIIMVSVNDPEGNAISFQPAS